MMQTMATRTDGTPQPKDMMGMRGMPDMPGMEGDGQMDAKTRAHLLQMRGEMLNAMQRAMAQTFHLDPARRISDIARALQVSERTLYRALRAAREDADTITEGGSV